MVKVKSIGLMAMGWAMLFGTLGAAGQSAPPQNSATQGTPIQTASATESVPVANLAAMPTFRRHIYSGPMMNCK